jgi:hypothetical protein
MRACVLGLLLTLWNVPPSGAQFPQSPLSVGDRAHLEEAIHFRLLDKSKLLLPDVVKYCADANGRLALPGDRWAPTDVLSGGNSLPRRRLVWAAQSKNFLVVHYEQGGFAHTYHVIVAQIAADSSKFNLLWRATGPRLRDYPNLYARSKQMTSILKLSLPGDGPNLAVNTDARRQAFGRAGWAG